MQKPIKKKDPKKVAAGRLGGKKSPSNFKRNPELARKAGLASAFKRNGGNLEDLPTELLLDESDLEI